MRKTLDKMEDWANGTLQLTNLSDSDLSNIIVALGKQVAKKLIYGETVTLTVYWFTICMIVRLVEKVMNYITSRQDIVKNVDNVLIGLVLIPIDGRRNK